MEDHRSRISPRYRHVADLLEAEILSGGLPAGARVPSERVIAEKHGLSRMTARQAIELLVRRGLVYRRPGSGTFVAPARVEHTLSRFSGFTETMRSQGIEPSGRVLAVRLIAGTAPDAEAALGLVDGQRCWCVRRVRFGDGEPLVVEMSHVPERVFPDLGRKDLGHASLYEMMRTVYGVDPVHAHETIESTACEPDDARHLSCRPGAPAILVTRLTYDADGRPVEFARDVYRGDRARFVVDLKL
jgi:GntR family transcriptional regulator